ncbi:LysE family translocator [Pleomorphomonas sp. JP5]|uniref:LysE family translocator n=1 Tax=Pleomorphomonas sp. JP5 TaxID=2942998 RepID=UPI0020438594|nr:LysE family transporter [Pleomorphomonas sp. JP5]MCM5557480.1 LysE family transporter [Pleomorphomonas sp. JP5]
MDTTILLSMASFALAASISPGPVNVIALASGIQHGFRRSFAYVSGATVGFTALLVLTGYGLNDAVGRLPTLMPVVKWAGIAFLFYMAFKLAFDRGDIDASRRERAPSFHHGALLRERIGNPAHVRLLNRTLAVRLVLSAGYLAWERV